MIYNSLEALIADREYQAYMQGLRQEPKYTPLPNGYHICGVCEMNTCRDDYKMCYTCLHKTNQEKYPLKNFKASIDASNLPEGHSRSGGDGDSAGETRQDKPNSVPVDSRWDEERIS